MNPALYYPWIYLRGGAERALIETVTRSHHNWTIYTNHFDADGTFPEFRDLPIVELPRITVRRTITDVVSAASTILRQKIDTTHHDAAMVVSEGLGNLLARRLDVPTSCICLTPLKVAYDSITQEHFFRGGRRDHYRLAFAGYRALDRTTWDNYRKVFCISEEVRSRVLDHQLVEPDRIEVAYPGVDAAGFSPTGEDEPFFLLPGRIMWQKQIERALEAWRWFKPHPQDSPMRLVIAGMVDEKSQDYLAELRRQVAWRNDVEFVVTPTDTELRRLYQRCRSVLFTAPNEDFGLVVLEAMACGKPVIATNQGGPRETVRHGVTGLLVSSRDQWVQALRYFAEMAPEDLAMFSAAARSRALDFGWDRFVERIDSHVTSLTGVSPDVRSLVGVGGK